MTSPAEISADYHELFQKKSFATFATLLPNGDPHLTVGLKDYDGENVVVNAARGRRNVRNVERDPRAAALIVDTEDPYRYLSVRG